MAGPFGDTFVEGADTLLEAHTPTGPNPGASWSFQNAGDGGHQITVRGASDTAEDTAFDSSNQYILNSDLGSDLMEVTMDVVNLIAGGGCSIRTRLDQAGFAGWVGGYDFAGGQWLLSDSVGPASTLVEAWPGGTVALRMQHLRNGARLFANGVLKLTFLSTDRAGNNFAGVELQNYTAGGPNHRVDNFQAIGIRHRLLSLGVR